MRRCKRLSDHRTVAYRHWLPIGVSPALAFAENGIDVAHQHAAKEWLGQEVLDASLPDRVAQLRDLLTAEQSTEVSDESEDDRTFGPERAKTLSL